MDHEQGRHKAPVTKTIHSWSTRRDAAETKGREIIASLSELAETLESGGNDAGLEPFTARTAEAPNPPRTYDASQNRVLKRTLHCYPIMPASVGTPPLTDTSIRWPANKPPSSK